MRRFKLINAEGAERDLNDPATFFHRPDGLGFERSISTVPAGYDFIETSDEPRQKAVTGEMVFAEYSDYQSFVGFCEKTPLVLGYMPIDKWAYLDCKVQGLGKGELEIESGYLICPIIIFRA